ncbi:MAG: flavin reductase family protein [Acidobacteriaceae bacterium]|nr:flavin reductase family protein [Acidobacteriaceae bacterium]
MSSEVDAISFRRACSRFATGITIATVLDPEGGPQGFTANSFTSVSADPALVLICVDRRANVLPHFKAAGHFAINVLRVEQKELSMRFAARGQDRFLEVDWRPGTGGVPLLAGALAQFECERREVWEAGDHLVFLGGVVAVRYDDGAPLLYYASGYRELGTE